MQVQDDSDQSRVERRGGCLCGAVAYRVQGPLRDVVLCHCSQCRRTHGHIGAYTTASPDQLTLTAERGLRWYASSTRARRGFCCECGATLFWEPADRESIAIAAGTLATPTGLKVTRQIYVTSAGDYYAIDPEIEAYPGTMRAPSNPSLDRDDAPADVDESGGC